MDQCGDEFPDSTTPQEQKEFPKMMVDFSLSEVRGKEGLLVDAVASSGEESRLPVNALVQCAELASTNKVQKKGSDGAVSDLRLLKQ